MFHKELRKIPFLRLLIPLLAGILLQDAVNVNLYLIIPGIILSFLLLLLNHILPVVKRSGRNILFGILVFIFIFLAGMGIIRQEKITNQPGIVRLGRVTQIPQEKDKTYKLILTGLREKESAEWHPVRGKILLYIEKSPRLENISPGDLLVFYCPMEQIKEPANPMEFNFRRYCYIHGIFWIGFLSDLNWLQLGDYDKFHINGCAERMRMELLSLMDSYDLHHQSLVSSLLLGYREDLDKQQKEAFAGSGAMHILAVSGLHVGIIYGMLMFLIKPFFAGRSGLSFLLPVPCIWLYALLTGMTPSVTRAALMLSIFAMSRYLNRKTSLLNIIFFSAFLMILFNPVIINRVSFQLSFMAVTGIAFIFPGLYAYLKISNRLINKILELLCMSVSAQLFTLPLSLFHFHQFPHYFLVTNLLVIPLAAMLLYSGFIFFLFSFSRTISLFLAHILNVLAGIMQKVINIISSLPFSKTNNIGLDIYDVILIYLFIFSIIGFLRNRSWRVLFAGLFILLIITGKGFYKKVVQTKQKNFMICSVEGATVMNFINGYQNVVITSDTDKPCRDRIIYHLSTYWMYTDLDKPEFIDLYHSRLAGPDHPQIIRLERQQENLVFIQFFNTKIGILSGQPDFKKQVRKPLELDLLIINSSRRVDLMELMNYITPGIIIIDRKVPQWEAMRLETACVHLGIPYHTIYNMGYFMMEY